jgi:hypothetical protein
MAKGKAKFGGGEVARVRFGAIENFAETPIFLQTVSST